MRHRESSEQLFRGGVDAFELLTITFVVLKLTGHIDWSWWWVLSPIWITVGATFGVVAVILVLCLLLPPVIKWLRPKKGKDVSDDKAAD